LQSAASGGETAPVSTASGFLIGTVEYMAPEQLQGGSVDQRTDIFALGMVLYEMATGRHPFVGRTPTSTIANILKDDPGPITQRDAVAPKELERIVHRCLRKSPLERYPSAGSLLGDLVSLRGSSRQNPGRRAMPAWGPLQLPRFSSPGMWRVPYS
jgi:eukaryotic-like serine/threonine-protein kinase